jgi:DNA-binding transcriptional LysR family regulator
MNPAAGAAPLGSVEEMRTFTRVAARGSFAAAARELGLSPSAVSRQIRLLEARLGVRLLNRTTRQVAPTELGRLYQERSLAILTEIEELEAAVRGLHGELRGTLRISAPQDFGRLFLCGVMGAFVAEFPELRLDFELTDRIVDVIEEGFDVALRITKLQDSSVVVRRLGRCQRLLCAAPGYLDRYGRPASPQDLAGHSCIEYAYLAAPGAWTFRVGGRRHSVVPTGRLRTNAGWAMRELALADQGIALLPAFLVAEDVAAGRLEPVLSDALEADLDVVAVLPDGRQTAAKVRAFVDFVAGRLRREPWWRS